MRIAIGVLLAWAGSAHASPYLALGDSIAFGFNPLLPYDGPTVASGKFVGYPEVVAAHDGLALTNASCPGESSGSFIDVSRPDHGCHSNENYSAHLKVSYSGDQLDYAVAFLAAHRDTQLVTLDIGANDLLVAQDACGGAALCEAASLPSVLATFAADLTDILARLRLAGYFGRIVVLTPYATNYTDLTQLTALSGLQAETREVADGFGATVAFGFDAFAAASFGFGGDPCKAGLLIDLGGGMCDKQPSAVGRDLLARTVMSAF
jgi:hypothetical protein